MSVNVKVDSLVDTLRARIQSGEFGDEKLPSFRELATEYNTTQETMNKTMQTLQAEGSLISRGTRGVYVNNQRIRVPGIVVDFSEYINEKGFNPKNEFIVKPEIIEPTEDVEKRMKLKKGEKILQLQRKQGTERSPFRISTEYFSMKFINKDMLDQAIADPYFNILLAIKENFKEVIGYTEEELVARLPLLSEQKQLEIVRTNPIIESKRRHWTKDKKAVLLYTYKIYNANNVMLSYSYGIDLSKPQK